MAEGPVEERLRLRLAGPGSVPEPNLGRDLAEGLRAVFVLEDGDGPGIPLSAADFREARRSAGGAVGGGAGQPRG